MKTTKMLTILVLALGLAAEVANADFVFGTPTNLGTTVNSSANDAGPSISADGLSLFFHSERSGGVGGADIWVTTRPTKDDEWGPPVNLGQTVNSSSLDLCPGISADGMMLFFASNRPGGYGQRDIFVTTRPTVSDLWGTAVNLGPTINSSSGDRSPSISADGLTLLFDSFRPGGSGGRDILVMTRETTDDDWGAPVNLGPTINTPSHEGDPTLSADGLWLFFHSNRPGGSGGNDLWATTRRTRDDPWGTPVNLGPTVNSSATDITSDITADGATLYFTSMRPGGVGGYDIWQAPIIPIVDFNGDGKVDTDDLLILIDNWGINEPLCDIGPTPFGDGIVDMKDLEVFMSYWEKENIPEIPEEEL